MYKSHFRKLFAAAAVLFLLAPSAMAQEAVPGPEGSAAGASSFSYPSQWNGDARYPIVYASQGTAWYEDSQSVKVAANDAEEMIFSIDIFMVHTASDPSAFEFQRFWFRRIRSDDVRTVYVRHGDIGEWSPLSLGAETENLPEQKIFLAAWQSATGFRYLT